MNKHINKKNETEESAFSRQVGAKEKLKLKARHKSGSGILFGFGLFGLIGWSVALPTVVGALLGIWLDKHYPLNHSWTLALLVAGLILGCFFAWYWISKENSKIQKDEGKKDE